MKSCIFICRYFFFFAVICNYLHCRFQRVTSFRLHNRLYALVPMQYICHAEVERVSSKTSSLILEMTVCTDIMYASRREHPWCCLAICVLSIVKRWDFDVTRDESGFGSAKVMMLFAVQIFVSSFCSCEGTWYANIDVILASVSLLRAVAGFKCSDTLSLSWLNSPRMDLSIYISVWVTHSQADSGRLHPKFETASFTSVVSEDYAFDVSCLFPPASQIQWLKSPNARM